MRNKNVWLVTILSLLILLGLTLVYIGDRSGTFISSLIYSGLVLVITVAFLLLIVYIYKKLYSPKVYAVATLTKRFWAFALDYLFIHLLLHILMVVVVIFLGDFKNNYHGLMTTLYGGRNAWFLTEIGFLGVYCLYSAIFDYKGGTPGKKAMDALVVSQTGVQTTLGQQMLRNFVKWLMTIPALFFLFFPYTEITGFELYFVRFFIVIYLYPKLNPERLFLQDFLTGTKVMDTKYGLVPDFK